MKKTLVLLFTLIAALALGSAASANTYDISNGSIRITSTSSGVPTVKQGSGDPVSDSNIVITGKSTADNVNIDATSNNVSVTLKDLDIRLSSMPCINITNQGFSCTINFEGKNKFECALFKTGSLGAITIMQPSQGTTEIAFIGKSGSSIDCDAVMPPVPIQSANFTFKNMKGNIGTIIAEGTGDITLNIDSCSLKGEMISVIAGGAADITVKNSNLNIVPVTETKHAIGCMTRAAKAATIRIDSSNVTTGSDRSTLALAAASYDKGGGGGEIILQGCEYKDPTHSTTHVRGLKVGSNTLYGAVTTAADTGKPVHATVITTAVPSTGDETPIALMAGLLLLSGAALVALKKRAAR